MILSKNIVKNYEIMLNRFQTLEDEFNTIHNFNFNYKYSIYSGMLKNMNIQCKKCLWIFEQTPVNHLQGKGCPICNNGAKFNEKMFIYKSNYIHNNFYDYSLINYVNINTKLKIICPIHGIFEQKPKYNLHGSGCQECGYLKCDNYLDINSYKNQKTILYYIKINNYYKIGLTKKSIEKRYKNENIDYIIIDKWEFKNGEHAFNIEQEILKETIKFKIKKEDLNIPGWTEVRNIDFYNLIVNKINLINF